jgi:hypothetical protein
VPVNLEEFKGQIDREIRRKQGKGLVFLRWVESILTAYDLLLLYSPVDTGAYRASHVVYLNEGPIFFEHTNRPGSDDYFGKNVGKPIFLPPRLDRLKELLLNLPAPVKLSMRNTRHYARIIEYGNEKRAPLYVYRRAFDAANAVAGETLLVPTQ